MKPRPQTVPPREHWPVIDLSGIVEPYQLSGESHCDTALRLILAGALVREGFEQKRAAKRIGVSPRVFNYYCHKFGWQPRQRAVTEAMATEVQPNE